MDSDQRRLRYKQLLDQGDMIRHRQALDGDDISGLEDVQHIVHETTRMTENVNVDELAQRPSEAVLDAQVLKMSHEIVSEFLQNSGSSQYSEEEYLNGLNEIMFAKDGVRKFAAVCEIARKILRSGKCEPCLLGSFEPTPLLLAAPKQKQQRAKLRLANEIRPQSIDQIEKQNDGGGKKINIIMNQILMNFRQNGKKPIPYYMLIIHPNDFMKSVDNAFQLSFLARDGYLVISSGEDGLPEVRPSTTDERENAGDETTQCISSLNPQLVKEMTTYYKLVKPMLNPDMSE